MIAEGTYRARAIDGALGKAKTGTEQIEVMFQLLDVAQTITWRGFFTEKTEERTMESLATADWNWVGLGFPVDAPEVSIVVAHEEGQDGNTYARVRWVNAAQKIRPKQALTEEEMAALLARLQGHESFPSGAVRAETQDTVDDFDPNNPNDTTPF